MELAIQIVTAMSGLGFLTLTILAFTHKQVTSTIIWVVFFTLVMIVLVPFLYWQKHLWEQESMPPPAAPTIVPSPTPATAKADERPYVFFKSAVLRSLEIGKSPILDIVVSNRGRTPAFKVGVQVAAALNKTRTTPAHSYEPPRSDVRVFLPVGAEKRTVTYNPNLKLSNEMLRKIEDKQVVLFFFAKGQYEDDGGKAYALDEVCYFYSVDLKTLLGCNPNEK